MPCRFYPSILMRDQLVNAPHAPCLQAMGLGAGMLTIHATTRGMARGLTEISPEVKTLLSLREWPPVCSMKACMWVVELQGAGSPSQSSHGVSAYAGQLLHMQCPSQWCCTPCLTPWPFLATPL